MPSVTATAGCDPLADLTVDGLVVPAVLPTDPTPGADAEIGPDQSDARCASDPALEVRVARRQSKTFQAFLRQPPSTGHGRRTRAASVGGACRQ